jgi:hypothetical protein
MNYEGTTKVNRIVIGWAAFALVLVVLAAVGQPR